MKSIPLEAAFYLVHALRACAGIFLLCAWAGAAEAAVVITYQEVLNPPNNTNRTFTTVPNPSDSDYADVNSGNGVTMSLAAGTLHTGFTAPVSALIDGKRAINADDSNNTVLFANHSAPAYFMMDLKNNVVIQQITTYSWHTTSRNDQFYTLYASADSSAPSTTGTLSNNGWVQIAVVNTIFNHANNQVGVSITDSSGVIGIYRHLLWDVRPNFNGDHTRFEEFDVYGGVIPEPSSTALILAGSLLLHLWRRTMRRAV